MRGFTSGARAKPAVKALVLPTVLVVHIVVVIARGVNSQTVLMKTARVRIFRMEPILMKPPIVKSVNVVFPTPRQGVGHLNAIINAIF